MRNFLIFIVGVVLFALLAPTGGADGPSQAGFRSGVAYAVFVLSIAASPLLGTLIAVAIGLHVEMKTALAFAWVGILASLPLSLLVAGLLGGKGRDGLWEYMESLSMLKMSRRQITTTWALSSATAFVFGISVLAGAG